MIHMPRSVRRRRGSRSVGLPGVAKCRVAVQLRVVVWNLHGICTKSLRACATSVVQQGSCYFTRTNATNDYPNACAGVG